MPRDRKGIIRKSGNQRKDPVTFFVIASEGTKTEPYYFGLLSKKIQTLPLGRIIKVEVLERMDTDSSFKRVIHQLDDYRKKYTLKHGDELWCLIDRDRIPEKNAAEASRLCRQKNYEFCLTSPCFELWLLLHVKNLSDFNQAEKQQLLGNKYVNASRTFAEQALHESLLAQHNTAYRKNALPAEILIHLPMAIQRAFHEQLDEKHWTFHDFCTRVHILMQRIFQADPPDFNVWNP